MEAVRDFIACEDTDRGPAPVQQSGVDGVEGVAGVAGVDAALAVLQAVSAAAVEDAGSWGLQAASDFAGRMEEFSRTVEYLQLVGAAAVDRTRKQSASTGAAAAGAVTSWTTGWRESPDGWQTGGSGAAEPAGTSAAGASGLTCVNGPGTGDGASGSTAAAADASSGPASVLDDGYRNTAAFLRARLRISAAEARRRLSLAESLLPRQGLAGRPVPPVHPELAAAVAAGEVASRAATVIAVALERVRPLCVPDAAARMEHALTRTAAENDADFLVRVTRSLVDALDQDGAEPSEELLRQLQGAFIRRRRHGLHHLEIYATTEQFEHLLTVMNTAANPRTGSSGTSPVGSGHGSAAMDAGGGPAAGASAAGVGWAADTAFGVGWTADAASGEGAAAGATAPGDGWAADTAFGVGWTADTAEGDGSVTAAAHTEGSVSEAAARVSACVSGAAGGGPVRAASPAADIDPAGAGAPATVPAPEDQPGPGGGPATAEDPALPVLDLRSRPQKLLDGLVGACKAALAAGTLPAAGGLRPQVMATIDYRDLLTRLQDSAGAAPESGPAGLRQSPGPAATGSLLFTGPVTASTIRKIACDADIIPVLLGGEGRVLDIGRASRVFPPHIRKALTARDRGCAFPGCTIPAPWCEAHHIDYWSRGGTTGTENGTLLCSHHHHVIHKEHWRIRLKSGIPWFIPPPHLDPRQHPRRNHYFRPTDPVAAARQAAARQDGSVTGCRETRGCK
ncbi:DUF222 domain-containing protein [Arthrobacter sp. NPDC056886]|uniref:HNH endonuclease signature motif containing protein n=1 Tax=Arthrobacter sp. NPDC056886 TaxID=3345960 RepID=UPI00367140B9